MTTGPSRRAMSLVVLLLALFPRAAAAQPPEVPFDLYQERLRQQGSSIAFCVNPRSVMAAFETALAEELAAALLLTANVIPVEPYRPTPPLDFRLPFTTDELFILMVEECDGFMGFTLASSGYPDWMTVTRPYMTTRTVLATTDPEYQSLADIPLDQPIGTRGVSAADSRFLMYLQSLRESERWRRFPYFHNQAVFDHLMDGTVAAALLWEPALYLATDGDPAAKGIHIIADLPFPLPTTEIGIALRSNDAYLNATLGRAIEALQADGTIDRLMQEHGLTGPTGQERPSN